MTRLSRTHPPASVTGKAMRIQPKPRPVVHIAAIFILFGSNQTLAATDTTNSSLDRIMQTDNDVLFDGSADSGNGRQFYFKSICQLL